MSQIKKGPKGPGLVLELVDETFEFGLFSVSSPSCLLHSEYGILWICIHEYHSLRAFEMNLVVTLSVKAHKKVLCPPYPD